MSMSDRELLEFAARAAGISIHYWAGDCPIITTAAIPVPWNPLTDDGDALRLAAKLVLNVLASEACILAEDENGVECIEYMYGPEDYTSGWRRVIVRAAAEIGSAMG